jgi:hypothetical protein
MRVFKKIIWLFEKVPLKQLILARFLTCSISMKTPLVTFENDAGNSYEENKLVQQASSAPYCPFYFRVTFFTQIILLQISPVIIFIWPF